MVGVGEDEEPGLAQVDHARTSRALVPGDLGLFDAAARVTAGGVARSS
jgi:hypothetical protein